MFPTKAAIVAAIAGIGAFFAIDRLIDSPNKVGSFILVDPSIVFNASQPPKNGDSTTPVRMKITKLNGDGDVFASFADPRIDVTGDFPVSSQSIVGKTS